jgi:tRNA modification GTPase TrmE
MISSEEIIVAQTTPIGQGGVGIVRVSGPSLQKIARQLLGKSITPRMATYSVFRDSEQRVIDQGIAIYFPAPHSYTGEDILELQGHGSQMVMELLVQRALELGARIAEPGEFTKRAFLNNKLDLVQAEAVADLISAASQEAARCAGKSLRGYFSEKINEIIEGLTEIHSRMVVMVDFVETAEFSELTITEIIPIIAKIISQLERLISSAMEGVISQTGIKVVLAGKSNVGKSSLFNCLSNGNNAIVTDLPGTTRDLLHRQINLSGMVLNLVDTAGFRDNPGVIEKEGIVRAKEVIDQADHLLYLVDSNEKWDQEPFFVSIKNKVKACPEINLTVVVNKIDLSGHPPVLKKESGFAVVYLSAKTKAGIDLLKTQILGAWKSQPQQEAAFSARNRHVEGLAKTKQHLVSASKLLMDGELVEIVLEEIRLAQKNLGEIIGKEVGAEDLLEKIFSEFCVGK